MSNDDGQCHFVFEGLPTIIRGPQGPIGNDGVTGATGLSGLDANIGEGAFTPLLVAPPLVFEPNPAGGRWLRINHLVSVWGFVCALSDAPAGVYNISMNVVPGLNNIDNIGDLISGIFTATDDNGSLLGLCRMQVQSPQTITGVLTTITNTASLTLSWSFAYTTG